MLFLSILIYLITALLVCQAIFETLSFNKVIITFFVTTFSINVLTGELLSLARLLNQSWAYLVVQLFFCTVIGLVIAKNRKLDLHRLIKHNPFQENTFRAVDYGLLVFIAGVLSTLFIVGIKTPPNNLDSLHTHLLRIYYWLQHGSLANWPATGFAQLNYPINAHLQGLWLFLLGNNENSFFLVSWFSLVTMCCVVYDIARSLNFSPRQSLFSVMVLLTFPIVLLQAYSFQNDLIVATMVLVAGWALLNYYRQHRLKDLVIVMLTLALSLGIKQTAFLVLPSFFITAIIMLVRKQVNHKHLPWLSLTVVFFLVFSFFKYGQNLITVQSLFGVEDVRSEINPSLSSIIVKAQYNIPRYLIEFINFDGMGNPLENKLLGVKEQIFDRLSSNSKIDLKSGVYMLVGFDPGEQFSFSTNREMSEDTSWFGPLFFIMTPISIFVVFLQKDKIKKRYALFALLYFFLYFLLIVFQRPGWDPYQGRYFILGVVPFVPLLGACIPNKRPFNYAIMIVITFASLYLAFNILCFNNSKPIITASTISNWQNRHLADVPGQSGFNTFEKKSLRYLSYQLYKNVNQRQSIFEVDYYNQLYYSETNALKNINLVNSTILAGEPIYLYTYRDPLEYGLFGINRSRNLYPVDSITEVPKNTYLFIENSRITTRPGFILIDRNARYSIYQRIE